MQHRARQPYLLIPIAIVSNCHPILEIGVEPDGRRAPAGTGQREKTGISEAMIAGIPRRPIRKSVLVCGFRPLENALGFRQMIPVVNKALKPQAELFVKFSRESEESSLFDA
jgi:hypothetical protein